MSGPLLEAKVMPQAPTFSPMDAFKKCHLETRLRVKEVVEHIVMNNIELTMFLMLSHQFINEQSINPEASSGLKEKLESWYDDILSSCLNFKRSTYRHISDFKFNLGTLKGCDKLFFGLDKVTETFRNSSMIEDLLKNGKALRTFLSEMVGIIEPNSEDSAASNLVANPKPTVEICAARSQQINLEVDVPTSTETQSKPQTDQQLKQAVTASPKPKTLVKTMDTNSLLGSLTRAPLQPVTANPVGPAVVSGQSTPEPKSVKQVRRLMSWRVGICHPCTQESLDANGFGVRQDILAEAEISRRRRTVRRRRSAATFAHAAAGSESRAGVVRDEFRPRPSRCRRRQGKQTSRQPGDRCDCFLAAQLHLPAALGWETCAVRR